jgi:uncharacterized protein (DUF4415 family)
MMISDEPDEDADNLDDEATLDTMFDNDPPARDTSVQNPTATADWLRSPVADTGLHLDAETLAWFKATHSEWQHEIRLVLRAWVFARTAEQRATRQLRLPAPHIVDVRAEDRP